MLWTDRTFIQQSDLLFLESDMVEIAAAEGIMIDGATGVACRALEEAQRSLARALQSWSGQAFVGDLSQSHLAAVFNTRQGAVSRKRVLMDQVVVSGRNGYSWSAVKHWAALHVLRAAYNAAANRTREDRYGDRASTFTKDIAGAAWSAVRNEGIPIVRSPLQSPAAFGARKPGAWVASAPAGSGTVNNDYSVAITYWNSVAALNNESHPSEMQTVTLSTGKVLAVSIAGLYPPTGTLDPADAAISYIVPMGATHWNVYAGVAGADLYLQNASPVPIATKTWTATGDPATTTAVVGIGQYADVFIPVQDRVFRG